MKKGILFIFTIYIFITAKAQLPNFQWANHFGSTSNYADGWKCTSDALGNVYIIGKFQGTVDFDPSTSVANISAVGSYDVFVAKYNSSGSFLWAFNIGGVGSEFGTDIAVDAANNVYVTGVFYNTADFDPSGTTVNLSSAGFSAGFVAKYNSSGAFQWAFKLDAASQSEATMAIELDGLGNICVTGYFGATVDFDPSGSVANRTSVGAQDFFLAKYTTAGTFVWAFGAGSTAGNADAGYGLDIDGSGNIYVIGQIWGTADFDPSGTTANINCAGASDIFVAKYSSTGTYLWAFGIGSSGDEEGFGICLDASNNVYITGDFSNICDFDPSTSVAYDTSNGNVDFYLAKYSSSGTYQWSFNFGDVQSDYGRDVYLDADDNVYVTGDFRGSIDCDPSSGIINLTSTSTSWANIFVAKYDSSGNYLFGFDAGDIISVGIGIHVDVAKNIYCTGKFEYSADFDPSPSTNSLFSTGDEDIYIAKYCQTSSQPGNITGNATICSGSTNLYSVTNDPFSTSYTWTLPGGWTGTSTTNSITTTASTTSGNITVTANNSCGSSTAQTLAVTVNSIPSTPGTITGNTTICSGSSNTYSVTNDPSATSYTWILPGGWTGTSTTNSITTTASTTSGNITVTANNSCGSSTAQTLAVTVNSIPSTPGTITGNTTICSVTNNTYSVTNDPSTTSYTWTLPGGWTGTSTTNSITTTASSTSGNITVSANNACGSSSTQTIAVTVNTIPSTPGTISGNTIICSGSSNTYSVINDPTATSYTWTLPGGWTGTSTTNSINTTASSTSGNITVTANNSCGSSSVQTLVVIVNALPNVTASAIDDIVCEGDPTTLTGGGASSYMWTGSVVDGIAFNPTATTSYTVTGTDVNSCSNTATITITVNSLPTVIFNYPGLDTICISYGIQTLSGGSPSGGTYSGTGVTGTNFDPNIAGVGIHTITYFYTDVNSCSSSHNIDIVVLGCAGINESGETTNILVYPNPFTNSISLSNIEELTRINIYNYLGEIIGSWQLDKNNNTIQSEQLQPGIYFITIENSRGTATNKIIKQH